MSTNINQKQKILLKSLKKHLSQINNQLKQLAIPDQYILQIIIENIFEFNYSPIQQIQNDIDVSKLALQKTLVIHSNQLKQIELSHLNLLKNNMFKTSQKSLLKYVENCFILISSMNEQFFVSPMKQQILQQKVKQVIKSEIKICLKQQKQIQDKLFMKQKGQNVSRIDDQIELNGQREQNSFEYNEQQNSDQQEWNNLQSIKNDMQRMQQKIYNLKRIQKEYQQQLSKKLYQKKIHNFSLRQNNSRFV